MTGEMGWIRQNGLDANGDTWPLHAAIARAVGGKLQPFDQYQGPYIVVGPDARIGRAPYAYCPLHLGVVRLWIISDGGPIAQVYREDTEQLSAPFWACGSGENRRACRAARELLGLSGHARWGQA